MISKKMQRALEADGEKLKALTGDNHGPYFGTEECVWPECGVPLNEECPYCPTKAKA